MKINNPIINKFGGFAIASTTRMWMSTLDYKVAPYNVATDPARGEFQGPAIFLLWHEYIPLLFYLRGHCDIVMLLSQHQDAEWLSQAARLLGYDTVRGSTNRGGVTALRELLRKSRSMNLAITPDGPRGPRRRLAPGPIYLSSRLQIPLICFGLGYQNPWRLNTWDRFALPRPYSRARVVPGEHIQIPANLDRRGVEQHRQHVEQTLNELTKQAEDWAISGERLPEQKTVWREARALHLKRAA